MSMPVETWICNELSKLLDIDAGEDIARYACEHVLVVDILIVLNTVKCNADCSE